MKKVYQKSILGNALLTATVIKIFLINHFKANQRLFEVKVPQTTF
jgi:hypothetical protein